MKKHVRDAATGLRDRLKAEGRHRDAQIIQDVLRSADAGRSVHSQLYSDNLRLKEKTNGTD